MLYLGEEVEDITRTVLLGPGEGRQKDQVHYSLFTRPPAYWVLIY